MPIRNELSIFFFRARCPAMTPSAGEASAGWCNGEAATANAPFFSRTERTSRRLGLVCRLGRAFQLQLTSAAVDECGESGADMLSRQHCTKVSRFSPGKRRALPWRIFSGSTCSMPNGAYPVRQVRQNAENLRIFRCVPSFSCRLRIDFFAAHVTCCFERAFRCACDEGSRASNRACGLHLSTASILSRHVLFWFPAS